MKRFLLLLVISVISTFMLAGCKKSAEESNKLVVGLNAEFPPFEYKEANGNIAGFDIDLMNEIGKLINKEIEYKNMSFDSILIAIQSGKIDISISGMTATEERKKFVNFTDPYYNSKQSIVVQAANTDITSFDNFTGKKIGVVLGYTGDILVSEMPNVEVQKFNNASETILALKSQKVDAVVLDYEPAKNYVAQNTELKLVETDAAVEEYSIAMRKEDTELLAQLNDALKTLKENGTYDALISKYFGE